MKLDVFTGGSTLQEQQYEEEETKILLIKKEEESDVIVTWRCHSSFHGLDSLTTLTSTQSIIY